MTDQPLGRRELNKQQTRASLIQAACDLLALRGDASTVEEIAERAGVSRATFFNYFPSKDDLLQAIYFSQMGELEELVSRLLGEELTTHQRVVGVFEDFAHTAREHSTFLFAFITQLDAQTTTELVITRSELLVRQFVRLIDQGVAQGQVRTDRTPVFLAQMVASIYLASLRFGRPDQSIDGFVDYFISAGEFAAESIA